MSDFIKVNNNRGNKEWLVNTKFIESVCGSTIYFAFNEPDCTTQDYIKCTQTYDEICHMILD